MSILNRQHGPHYLADPHRAVTAKSPALYIVACYPKRKNAATHTAFTMVVEAPTKTQAIRTAIACDGMMDAGTYHMKPCAELLSLNAAYRS